MCTESAPALLSPHSISWSLSSGRSVPVLSLVPCAMEVGLPSGAQAWPAFRLRLGAEGKHSCWSLPPRSPPARAPLLSHSPGLQTENSLEFFIVISGRVDPTGALCPYRKGSNPSACECPTLCCCQLKYFGSVLKNLLFPRLAIILMGFCRQPL